MMLIYWKCYIKDMNTMSEQLEVTLLHQNLQKGTPIDLPGGGKLTFVGLNDETKEAVLGFYSPGKTFPMPLNVGLDKPIKITDIHLKKITTFKITSISPDNIDIEFAH